MFILVPQSGTELYANKLQSMIDRINFYTVNHNKWQCILWSCLWKISIDFKNNFLLL